MRAPGQLLQCRGKFQSYSLAPWERVWVRAAEKLTLILKSASTIIRPHPGLLPEGEGDNLLSF